jgi:hypothetical protein
MYLRKSASWREAEAAYRRAIDDDAEVSDSHLQLGDVLKMQAKKDESEAAYLRASLSIRFWTPPRASLLGTAGTRPGLLRFVEPPRRRCRRSTGGRATSLLPIGRVTKGNGSGQPGIT